jgi:hypothetical protein
MTAAAFVVLAIVLGIGFFTLNVNRENDKAGGQSAPVPKAAEPGVSEGKLQAEVVASNSLKDKDVLPANENRPMVPAKQPRRAEVASTVADGSNTRKSTNTPAPKPLVARSVKSVKKAPNLSGIEEDEDTTVRLTDLFAEVSSRKEE